MSKANGVVNTIAKIITWVLVVLLVLGVAGGLAYLAMRSQGMTYYVEYGGERYVANGEGGSVWLPTDSERTFAVKSLTGNEVNYSVKVTSNDANNFDFVLNGENYQFFGTDDEKNDYTDVFGVTKTADGFMLVLPEDFTVEQAIEKKYGGDVELQSELQDDYCYFVLTVTADKSVVNLWFCFSRMEITLDPPTVVF